MKRILVVDDERNVRALARDILEVAGYRVLEAPDGDEALRLAAGDRGPIHLLLTDVLMPGMNGRELAERLRARRQGMKVVFMSGYPADVIGEYGVLATEIPFIAKPFSLTGLTDMVSRILDYRSPFARQPRAEGTR